MIQPYASQVVQGLVKYLPAKPGDIRDAGSIPRLGRSPVGGNGNPLQYSCLENSMEGSLVGYSPWGCKESNMTEHTHTHRVNSALGYAFLGIYSFLLSCPTCWHIVIHSSPLFLNILILFIYLFILAALGLHCCAWAFSSCGKWRLLISCSAWASHCGGLSWALGTQASAVHGLSCPVACGLFWTREQACIHCSGRQTLNHWTTRGVP